MNVASFLLGLIVGLTIALVTASFVYARYRKAQRKLPRVVGTVGESPFSERRP